MIVPTTHTHALYEYYVIFLVLLHFISLLLLLLILNAITPLTYVTPHKRHVEVAGAHKSAFMDETKAAASPALRRSLQVEVLLAAPSTVL